jgi:NADH-quinone oxidoreductase subunit G
MVSIHIDDIEVSVKPSLSILEACKYVGINIPRFCYHETLSVAGNCRMCLVEIEEAEKPVASCVTEISEGMSVYTDSAFVKKSRENVVEALLLNHPLDCPICDQAGECDLQDQVKKYGSTSTRYFFKKKGVEDKYCGPLIKTIMTRCISCTRCVRFSSEIAGSDFFGTLNRGGSTEIGSYLPNFFNSEISSNVVDLCPVGALTSLPYAFKARPWELRLVESIDTTDSLGSNIYINYKETEIFRVLPKQNKELNDNLISDRARYNFDANNNNRIVVVYSYNSTTKKYSKIGWKKFIKRLDNILFDKTQKFVFFIDGKTDWNTLVLLKSLSNKLPSQIFLRTVDTNIKENLFIEPQISINESIEKVDGSILFLGTNPKLESTILNAKIRTHLKNNFINSYSLGLSFTHNWKTAFINLSTENLFSAINGKNNTIAFNLFNKKSLILVGENFNKRIANLNFIIQKLKVIFPSTNTIFIGQKANTSSVNSSNIKSYSSNLTEKTNNAFFINIDDVVATRKNHLALRNSGTKTVWHNTHGSYLAVKSDFILPATSNYEEELIFLNLEYNPQKTQIVMNFNNASKSFSNTIEACFEKELTFSKKNSNLEYQFLSEKLKKNYSDSNLTEKKNLFFENFIINKTVSNLKTQVSKYPIFQEKKNFYQIDNYTRNSHTLSQCTNELIKVSNNFE